MVSQPFLYIYIYMCVEQHTIAMMEVTHKSMYNIFYINTFYNKPQ